MAKMETLSDPFNTTVLNTSLWSSFSGAGGSVTPGTGGLSCTASSTGFFSGVLSLASYDLTGSYLLVNAASIGIAATGQPGEAWLMAGTTASSNPASALKAVVSSGTLYMGNRNTNFGSAAYDPVAHAWWRIREAAGTTYFEVSPDGSSWTVLGSCADSAHGIPMTALYASVSVDVFGSVTETAVYKSLNPAPSAVNALAGLATATGTVPAPAIVDEASANAAMAAAAGTALPPSLTLAAFAPARLATALARAPQASVITAGPPPPVPVKGYCEATVTQPWAATATVTEEGSCEATVTQPMTATATVS